MSKRVAALIGRVYEMMGETDVSDNPVFSESRLLGALNEAQRACLAWAFNKSANYGLEAVVVTLTEDKDRLTLPVRWAKIRDIWLRDSSGKRKQRVELRGRWPRGAWLEGSDPGELVFHAGQTSYADVEFWMQRWAPEMHTGTLPSQSGVPETAVDLASSATLGEVSATDDHYNGLRIYIETGTGAGQERVITDYAGDTKRATVAAWETAPVEADTYCIESVLEDEWTETVAQGAAERLLGEDEGDRGGGWRAWQAEMRRDTAGLLGGRAGGRRLQVTRGSRGRSRRLV